MAVDAERAKSLFLAASDLEDPAERAAYLERECGGDAALRARVEALLRANDAARLPDGPAATVNSVVGQSATEDYADPTARVGAILAGKYKLIEEIGEGGMGSVFLAQQTGPVKRPVAVKVIKAGMDSREVLARFEAERQALAMMDHPNIAKVLDAGTTDGGRPFFVMELVKGVPITRYCDEHKLTPRQRLELFVPVCQAVQHAHQKGIIHRDIKPSNVLVALYDDRPMPKVIDFGVAKAAGQELTDKTLLTGFGALVGTPEYMSPEQASLNNLDIDTRSDVYSLGVLLYELLTGTTPVDRKSLRDAALLEILRMVREEEAPRPSAKLRTIDTLPSVAANRATEPARLSRLMKGELDWLVMKALEKDRSRRYETANGLAQDIQRYLNDEPVQAGPPSVGYRLRKFVKRHRGPVLAAVLVLAALLAGIVGTVWGLVEALHQQEITEQARRDEAVQRGIAVANATESQRLAKEEKAARDKADKQLLRAEWLHYASQISRAHREWDTNDVPMAYHFLNACRRDFRGWEHNYLYTLFNSNQKTFQGHKQYVLSVAFSPDGKQIVSGSGDEYWKVEDVRPGELKVWDAATGQDTLILQGQHTGAVTTVAFSSDGTKIVSYSAGELKVWDAGTGKNKLTIKLGGTLRALSADASKIVSDDFESTSLLKVWDATTGQHTQTLKGHTGNIGSAAFSPDGKKIVSGGGTDPGYPHRLGEVKIWDATTGKDTLTFKGNLGYVTTVAFSPDGKKVVGGSRASFVPTRESNVKAWDTLTGAEIHSLEGLGKSATSVSFSPDGKKIVIGTIQCLRRDDPLPGTLEVWDAVTGQHICTHKGGSGPLLGFSPDSKKAVSASAHHTLEVWETATGQDILALKGYSGGVAALAPDGMMIVSGGNTLKVWDSSRSQDTRTIDTRTDVNCLAISPNGKRIASGMYVWGKLWDAVSGRETATLNAGIVSSVAFSPDGTKLVTGAMKVSAKGGGEGMQIDVWDAATGKNTLTIKGSGRYVAFSRDGKKIVGTGEDGTFNAWDAATGEKTLTVQGPPVVRVTSMVFSPDGTKIVCGTYEGTGTNLSDYSLKVWDAATGQNTLILRGHTSFVRTIAFSPDGKRIVSGSDDTTIKMWDVATGEYLRTLRGHLGQVSSVVFSPDGSRIVSTGGTLKVWDAASGEETLTLTGSYGRAAFNADGNKIVSSSGFTIKVWDATLTAP